MFITLWDIPKGNSESEIMSKKEPIDWRNEPQPTETDLRAIMLDEDSPRTRFRRWNTVLNWAVWNGLENDSPRFNVLSWVGWAAKREGFNRYGGRNFSPNEKVDRLQELVDGCIERGGKKPSELTDDERAAIAAKAMSGLDATQTKWMNDFTAGIPTAATNRWSGGDMSDQKFLQKVVDQIVSGRKPSQKQVDLCYRILNREAERKKQEDEALTGFDDVVALLNCAIPYYKKSPKIKMYINGRAIVMYISRAGKNVGSIVVKEDWSGYEYNAYGDIIGVDENYRAKYYGRISPEGMFYAARAASLIDDTLHALKEDALGTVARYGKRLGRMGRITQQMMDDWKKDNGLDSVNSENIKRAKQQAKAKEEGRMGNLTGVSKELTLAELMGTLGNDSTEEE